MLGWLRRRRDRPASQPEPSQLATPADLARRVHQIEIGSDRWVDSTLAGGYRSVFRGRGLELAGVRPYQAGDDVRAIDWNVTARLGTPYVKELVQERDLTVFTAVDVSGSLAFGSAGVRKRELAAELAVLLSFAALRHGDRAGAALMAEEMELFLKPNRRRSQVLRLAKEILARPDGGGTDLERGLTQLLANLRQRAVLILISDFVEADCPRALRAAASRHEVVVIELTDPVDDHWPDTAPVVLRDAETGTRAVVGGRRRARLHQQMRQERRQERIRLAREIGAGHLLLSTDRPYLPELARFFDRRGRRPA